jgi:hypothetical protein
VKFDRELIVMGRIWRELETITDGQARLRIATFIMERVVAAANGPPEPAHKTRDRILSSLRCVHAIPLGELCAQCAAEGPVTIGPGANSATVITGYDASVQEATITSVETCRHGTPVSDKCFGCEAEALPERHSEPPSPLTVTEDGSVEIVFVPPEEIPKRRGPRPVPGLAE